MSVIYVKERKRFRARVGSGSNRRLKDFKSKRDALVWEAQQKCARSDNGFEKLDFPLETLVSEYLETLDECTKKHQDDVRKSLSEIFEKWKLKILRDLTSNFAETFKHESKLSSYRTNAKLGFLKSLSNFARKKRYIFEDRLADVVKKSVKKEEKRALLENELNDILFISKKYSWSFHSLLLFLANTGCRKCEGVTLEWENIDFKNRLVRIYDKPHILINGEPFRCKWGSSRVIPEVAGKNWTTRLVTKIHSKIFLTRSKSCFSEYLVMPNLKQKLQ